VNSEKGCIMAFVAHLNAPHVIEFRKQIKDIVEKVSVKVLKEFQ